MTAPAVHRLAARLTVQPLLTVAAICLLVQTVSATVQRRPFESPNMAAEIARNLADQGSFEVAGRRAYQLPGESWYLALGLVLAPDAVQRYLHVPVTVLLVTALAAVAQALAGPTVALGAGLAATFDPFMLVHGPVWDDTFLAAALEWTILAIIVVSITRARPLAAPALCGVGLIAGVAALTRTATPISLIVLGAALVLMPSLRARRQLGMALIIGVALALTAWGARNAVVLGTFYAGTTRDGKALFEANCAYTRQGIRETGVVGGFLDRCNPIQAAQAALLDEVEADAQLRRYALDYMTSNPADVGLTALFKLAVSVTGYDFASPPLGLRNLVGVTANLLVILIGACGLAVLRKTPARMMPVETVVQIAGLSTLAATLAMLAVGPVGLRYRVSLTAFLYLGIGVLIARLVDHGARCRISQAIPAHVSIR